MSTDSMIALPVINTDHGDTSIQLNVLTLNLLTTTIVAPPSNASKWQMGFNSAFKGLMPVGCRPLALSQTAHRV